MLIRYYVEDSIVREDATTCDIAEAIETALEFDVPEFKGCEDMDLCVDVRDEDNTSLFWANTFGERGSDYSGENHEINQALEMYLF